jgi:MFS family permease
MAGRRNLILAAAIAGLIALVAVASRGHAPAGNGPTHAVDTSLLWEFFFLVFVAFAAVVLPVSIWTFLWSQASDEKRRARRRRQSLQQLVLVLALGFAAVLVMWTHVRGGNGSRSPIPLHLPSGASAIIRRSSSAHFDWLPAIVMLSLALVGAAAVAYLLFRKQPRARRPTEAELAAQLSAVLDDTLDDLRAESDPRRAVIAAYARMEVTLAGAGLPRDAAETPLEYLGRVLRELLHTSAEAVARLTALFERAKFSTHEIDAGMKADAIDALVTVRDELRAAT